MKIPADKIPLHKWVVYRAQLPFNSQVEHRIIIVYKTEETIDYFYVTSKEEKVKERYLHDPKGFILIKQKEWSETLTRDSYIQCGKGHLKQIRVLDFQKMYEEDLAVFIGTLPKEIENRILEAINQSKTYTIAEKKKYTG